MPQDSRYCPSTLPFPETLLKRLLKGVCCAEDGGAPMSTRRYWMMTSWSGDSAAASGAGANSGTAPVSESTDGPGANISSVKG